MWISRLLKNDENDNLCYWNRRKLFVIVPQGRGDSKYLFMHSVWRIVFAFKISASNLENQKRRIKGRLDFKKWFELRESIDNSKIGKREQEGTEKWWVTEGQSFSSEG